MPEQLTPLQKFKEKVDQKIHEARAGQYGSPTSTDAELATALRTRADALDAGTWQQEEFDN